MKYVVTFYRVGEGNDIHSVEAYVVEADSIIQAFEALVGKLGVHPFRQFGFLFHPVSQANIIRADEREDVS